MRPQDVGIAEPEKVRQRVSPVRIGMALALAAFLVMLPSFSEEWTLARLSGDWVEVHNEKGVAPSGLEWEVRSGSGTGGDFCRVLITRRSKESTLWWGNADELPPGLRVCRDRSCPEPRFLCYQPLSFGPRTSPCDTSPGYCLVEGDRMVPILVNPLSLFSRAPLSGLFGWGSNQPDYSSEAGLLDRP